MSNNSKRVVGISIAAIGLVLLLLNSVDYLFNSNFIELSPAVGLMLAFIGAGMIKQSQKTKSVCVYGMSIVAENIAMHETIVHDKKGNAMANVIQWEYRTVKFPASGGFLGGRIDTAAFNTRLNELGEQGWELLSALATNQGYGWSRDIVAIFRREKR